jgi:CO/xanthine dehydrogenase Mo-binding subunit
MSEAPAQTTGALAQTAAGRPPLVPAELDSWIAILPDGRVNAFFGKMDMGQGLDIAVAQIVAEELDVGFDKVEVLMGDTATSCNQGGASGSTGVSNGARLLRRAAAEARRVLVEGAAQKLGVPAAALQADCFEKAPDGVGSALIGVQLGNLSLPSKREPALKVFHFNDDGAGVTNDCLLCLTTGLGAAKVEEAVCHQVPEPPGPGSPAVNTGQGFGTVGDSRAMGEPRFRYWRTIVGRKQIGTPCGHSADK